MSCSVCGQPPAAGLITICKAPSAARSVIMRIELSRTSLRHAGGLREVAKTKTGTGYDKCQPVTQSFSPFFQWPKPALQTLLCRVTPSILPRVSASEFRPISGNPNLFEVSFQFFCGLVQSGANDRDAAEIIQGSVLVDHAVVAHQRNLHPSRIEFTRIGHSFIPKHIVPGDLNMPGGRPCNCSMLACRGEA